METITYKNNIRGNKEVHMGVIEQGNRGKAIIVRVLTGLCLGLMLWLGKTEAVRAYEPDSQLQVGDVFVVNYGKLQTSEVKGDTGKATYDEKTNTLTLDNFSLTEDQAMGMCQMSGLKIVLKGTNTFHCETGGIYAAQMNGLTICGSGSLKMVVGNRKTFGFGINARCDLTIQNCTVDIQSSSNALGIDGILLIENANLKLKRTLVDSVNGPGKTYYKRVRYNALAAGELRVKSSTVDVCGINYALGITGLGGRIDKLQPPTVPVLSNDMMVVDETGASLKLARQHWWEDCQWTKRYEYVYSRTATGDLNGFEGREASVHVIMKQKPKKEEPPKEDSKEDTSKPTEKPAEKPSEKPSEKPVSSNPSYSGDPKTGKVTYSGPINKNLTFVSIPSTIRIGDYTCKVTGIGKRAFYNCKKLKSVTIGSQVKSIGTEAFRNCTSLKTVKMGSSVESIGKKAFYNCSRLSSLTLGENVSSISDYAFYKCTSLSRVKLPSKLTYIKTGTFKGCEKLKSISIGGRVKSIGTEAFRSCTSLKTVKMGSSVKSIGKKAFYNCKKLNSLTIGKNVSSISDYAFSKCTSLSKVSIPSKVKTIKSRAFYNCKKLKSVTFKGKSIKSVGKYAFRNTAKRIKVSVPKSKYKTYRKILKGKGFSSPVYYKK